MKLIVLTTLVAAASASGSFGYHGNALGGGAPFRGVSGAGFQGVAGGAGYGSQDYYAKPNYNYGYSVKDPYSGVDIDAQENRYGYQTQGSYGTTLPDGRRQNVNYIVDGDSGFQADVQYYGVAQHPSTPINAGYGKAGLRAGALRGGAGLRGATLGGAGYSGAALGGADYSGATLGGAGYSGAALGGAAFGGAGFRRAAGFGGAGYGGAGYSGAALGGGLFRGARFGRSGLRSGYGGCTGYSC
ncbi:glycine-rich cell wall structural protein 1.0-like [Amphibalanus amphitrite]|uniref:glycine-rich cell wall structural protein 1.0-like n=1 Tax=Amphibalanus amphitrite TaxID=1232801 RepID=UPI001C90272C|nr:glycine-rich cell wall structural protein 1.0-like [Amphibalanus amphitrite]